MTARFCLVAGSGDLVNQIVAAAVRRGPDVHVLSLTGPRDFGAVPVIVCDPGNLDSLFGAIRKLEARFVVLAGYVSEATWDALHAHPALNLKGERAGTAELARRLERVLPELTGAQLVGIHEIAPELIAPAGPIAGPELSDDLRPNVLSALTKARELGWKDVGQAVVLSPEGALEAEDAAGTDALLSRIAAQRHEGDREDGAWILAKALKPHQPLSMDIPVIGPATVENARKAGISVIAVEAGGAVIVDRASVEKAAGAAGISVVGLSF
jgi:DUF1009 family protein